MQAPYNTGSSGVLLLWESMKLILEAIHWWVYIAGGFGCKKWGASGHEDVTTLCALSSHFWAHLYNLHGGLICITFRLSVTWPKIRFDNNFFEIWLRDQRSRGPRPNKGSKQRQVGSGGLLTDINFYIRTSDPPLAHPGQCNQTSSIKYLVLITLMVLNIKITAFTILYTISYK